MPIKDIKNYIELALEGDANGAARKFAKEMILSGTVDAIRNESGNIRYDYFFPVDDEETVLLIDSWENQKSIDFHHQSPMMKKINPACFRRVAFASRADYSLV